MLDRPISAVGFQARTLKEYGVDESRLPSRPASHSTSISGSRQDIRSQTSWVDAALGQIDAAKRAQGDDRRALGSIRDANLSAAVADLVPQLKPSAIERARTVVGPLSFDPFTRVPELRARLIADAAALEPAVRADLPGLESEITQLDAELSAQQEVISRFAATPLAELTRVGFGTESYENAGFMHFIKRGQDEESAREVMSAGGGRSLAEIQAEVARATGRAAELTPQLTAKRAERTDLLERRQAHARLGAARDAVPAQVLGQVRDEVAELLKGLPASQRAFLPEPQRGHLKEVAAAQKQIDAIDELERQLQPLEEVYQREKSSLASAERQLRNAANAASAARAASPVYGYGNPASPGLGIDIRSGDLVMGVGNGLGIDLSTGQIEFGSGGLFI